MRGYIFKKNNAHHRLELMNSSYMLFFLCLAFWVCGLKVHADVINVPAGGDIQAAVRS